MLKRLPASFSHRSDPQRSGSWSSTLHKDVALVDLVAGCGLGPEGAFGTPLVVKRRLFEHPVVNIPGFIFLLLSLTHWLRLHCRLLSVFKSSIRRMMVAGA